MDKQAKGKLGEDTVCAELEKRGHAIITRNYHKRTGEIDIISAVGQYIVFTEVKTRKVGAMVSGLEAVNFAKKKKIVLTADAYLTENRDIMQKYPFVRYDIAEVWITRGDPPQITRINIVENAFDTEGIYTVN
ncbi:MAG: YraN family protein [Oscillospiraceae bacterium]|nr:YraN family protein [Oscillospiraceae bacterium]